MRVDLTKLEPNPMRDFMIDPIDQEVVEKLRESIEEDGFWGGVVCRKIGDRIEIGAGHHRVRAAVAAGIRWADVYVDESFDEFDMWRVYTRENATQRGNSGTAMAGSVASALRLVAKALFLGDIGRILPMSERGEQTIVGKLTAEDGEGIGRRLLTRLFQTHHISGMGDYRVQQ